ncbi:tetratricopeptide repeat protein [Candidatus Dependentiae bacterium]
MKNRVVSIKSLVLILGINLGCIFFTQNETEKSFELIWSLDDIESQNYFLYAKGAYQRIGGKPFKAAETFKKLNKDNISFYAYDAQIRLFFDLHKFKKIVALGEKIKKHFRDNLDIQLILAQSYLNLNLEQNAEKYFIELSKKYPDNDQIAYYTTVSYIKNNKLHDALDFINKCLSQHTLRSKHFLFHFLASKVYLHLRRYIDALEHIKKSVNLYPKFEKGWLLKALLEEQLGRINHAIAGYKRFLDIVGEDLAVEKQLVRLLFNVKKYKQAANTLRNMNLTTPEYFFDLALIERRANNFKQSLKDINKLLEKFPNFNKAKILKVEVLLLSKQKQEALDFATKWLSCEPNSLSAVKILILLQKRSIPKSLVISALEKVLKKNKSSQIILAALADLYLEEGNLNNVIKYCNSLNSITNSDALKSKLLFQIAYAYFEQKKDDKVEKYLKKAMNYKPVYPSVYNLLAYFYAQKNKNLHQAIKLSEMALELNPDCYYYLDTKGYVLLKLGKIEDAIKNFEKALSVVGKDRVVEHHLRLARNLKK